MSVKLIINADDFGLCESVNQAIIEVFETGNLTSTTLMVNMPGTEDAVARAKDHPGLGVGLHFCLTEGTPLTKANSLTGPDGAFISRSELVKRILKKQVDPKEIRQEFEAQLEKGEALGISFTHADSHQHIMMLPAVFRAVQPVLEKRELAVRVVRPPKDVLETAFRKPVKAAKQVLNVSLSHQVRKRFRGAQNDYLVSIHDLESIEHGGAETYLGLLQPFQNSEVVELMVHPYIVSEELRSLYPNSLAQKQPFFDKCEWEYRMLSEAPLFQEFELVRFSDIL